MPGPRQPTRQDSDSLNVTRDAQGQAPAAQARLRRWGRGRPRRRRLEALRLRPAITVTVARPGLAAAQAAARRARRVMMITTTEDFQVKFIARLTGRLGGTCEVVTAQSRVVQLLVPYLSVTLSP